MDCIYKEELLVDVRQDQKLICQQRNNMSTELLKKKRTCRENVAGKRQQKR